MAGFSRPPASVSLVPGKLRHGGVIAARAETSVFAMHPPQVMGIQPLDDFHT